MAAAELVEGWSSSWGIFVNVVASLVRSELEADEEASHTSLWMLDRCTDATHESHARVRDRHLEFPLVDAADSVRVKDHDTCRLGVLICVVEFVAVGNNMHWLSHAPDLEHHVVGCLLGSHCCWSRGSVVKVGSLVDLIKVIIRFNVELDCTLKRIISCLTAQL